MQCSSPHAKAVARPSGEEHDRNPGQNDSSYYLLHTTSANELERREEPLTIHTPLPNWTSKLTTVKSRSLFFATMPSATSAASVTLDTMAVIIERISAQIETPWFPRKSACTNVRRDRPADTGCRTRRTSSAFRRTLTRDGERPRSCGRS